MHILIAEVDRVRGLVGEVVVTVHADDPGRMADLASVFLKGSEGYQEIAVEGYKRLRDRAVLKLAGYTTPEEARKLVGRELFIPAEASTPAPPGRYYAYQLLGLRALLPDGQVVGTVSEVLDQGSQSLLVIEGPSGEVLVPAVKPICVAIDVTGGTITIDPPDGLIDLNKKR